MAMTPLTITNYERMGELVKKWANKTIARPKDLKQLEEQLDQHQVGHNLRDANFKTLKFIDEPSDVLVIRLPPSDVLKQVEKKLAEGGVYAMPPFYAEIFGKQPNIPQAQKNKVHAERIGDYTINFCA
jgi:hypothetical protein